MDMSVRTNINFTKHAKDMLVERRFKKEMIEGLVAKAEWTDKGEGDIWYVFKRTGRKVLRVVVKGDNPSTVITMYFDRRIK